MRVTYLITAENFSDFDKELVTLLDRYGEAWRGEENSHGLNWWVCQPGHPAESGEEISKKLRLACLEHSIGETVVKERSI